VVSDDLEIEQVYSIEDQAVFAFVELLKIYTAKSGFVSRPMFKKKDGDDLMWSFQQLGQIDCLMPNCSAKARFVLESPIRSALRNAMELIGETLWEQTQSTELMHKVAMRVEKIFDETDQGGKVASVLDHVFDGIGTWVA
jgi:hypothetical protein